MSLGESTVLEPYAGVKGIWDFSSSDLAVAAGTPVADDELRAKLELGASLRTMSGLSVRGLGAYDGVGSGDYHAYQGQLQVIVPLQ